MNVKRNEPFVSLSDTSSLPFTNTATLLSDGGFCTVTAYSTGWVTQRLAGAAHAHDRRRRRGRATHLGSVVSLPISSTQKLLHAFGVTRR